MAALPIPVGQVIPVAGSSLIVHLYNVPEIPNEVYFEITRNVTRETRFSISELGQVLSTANSLLAQARTKAFNQPKK